MKHPKSNMNTGEAPQTTGQRIRALRKSRGLTLDELAEELANLPGSTRTDCSGTQLGYIERGQRPLSADYCDLVARFFGVRAAYLRCETDIATDVGLREHFISTVFNRRTELEHAMNSVLDLYGFTLDYNDAVVDDANAASLLRAIHNDVPNGYALFDSAGEVVGTYSARDRQRLAEDIDDAISTILRRFIERRFENG